MNALRIVVRFVLAWMALLAAQIVVGMVVHPKTPANPHPMLFLMVSNAFIVLALGWAALRSDWRDWRLLIAVFFVRAVVEFANWIEGALYLTRRDRMARRHRLRGADGCCGGATLAARISWRTGARIVERSSASASHL
jgi:hypothetical protein